MKEQCHIIITYDDPDDCMIHETLVDTEIVINCDDVYKQEYVEELYDDVIDEFISHRVDEFMYENPDEDDEEWVYGRKREGISIIVEQYCYK